MSIATGPKFKKFAILYGSTVGFWDYKLVKKIGKNDVKDIQRAARAEYPNPIFLIRIGLGSDQGCHRATP